MKEHLACTFITMHELSKTHNLYKNQDGVRKAVKAIKNYGSTLCTEDPFDFALSKFIDGYQYDRQRWMRIWNSLEWLLRFEVTFPEENIPKIEKLYATYNKQFDQSISEINELAIPIKARIKANKLKKQVRGMDYTNQFRRFLTMFLIQYHQENENGKLPIGISLNSERWRQLEFISEVWKDFFKELDVNPSKKFKSNDWGDLLNMIYVGPNDHYWTKERQWMEIIKRNPIAKRYLYSPPPQLSLLK